VTQRAEQILTLAAISAVAWALCDMTHEVVGHIGVSWLIGLKVSSLSAKGMATTDLNASDFGLRLMYMAGTLADAGFGALALVVVNRLKRPTAAYWFLLLYGAFGLFNLSYLVTSPLSGSGDWFKAIAGFSPPVVWRWGVMLTGVLLYALSVRWVAMLLLGAVFAGRIARRDLVLLIGIGYFVASTVQAAAVFANRITPGLESPWETALSVIWNQNIGLFIVAYAMLDHLRKELPAAPAPLPVSRAWMIAGALTTAVFIGVIGHGLMFVPS
jgi:hypothetical protein